MYGPRAMTDSDDVSFSCPACGGALDDNLACAACGLRGRFESGVYRFVDEDYAGSFGAQWKRFARTQLDGANGTRISEERFASITGWTPEMLRGRTVLDGGCGAGRFTEVALRWGAKVTSVDLSEAVFAARENVVGAERGRFVQGDCLKLPFAPGTFDFVFSIGVAQHTPDPEGFVRSLARRVKPGGRGAFWIYERTPRSLLHFKYLLRPITSRLPVKTNMRLAEGLVDVFFPVAERLASLPRVPRKVAYRALPIALYLGELDLPRDLQREWSTLDTLDWYSPTFDHPLTWSEAERVLREAGASHIERAPVPGVTPRFTM